MKENYELMEHIYKDAEMAVYTLTTLTNDLKDKDNKIKIIKSEQTNVLAIKF